MKISELFEEAKLDIPAFAKASTRVMNSMGRYYANKGPTADTFWACRGPDDYDTDEEVEVLVKVAHEGSGNKFKLMFDFEAKYTKSSEKFDTAKVKFADGEKIVSSPKQAASAAKAKALEAYRNTLDKGGD